jgi:hypothetical protein
MRGTVYSTTQSAKFEQIAQVLLTLSIRII